MKPARKISLYAAHVARWKSCTRCSLHHGRQHVVLAKGQIPCDVLCIGEAPGTSEDATGIPFIGPAGYLISQVVESALAPVQDCRQGDGLDPLRVGWTNVVACIPRNEEGEKGSPELPEIKACRPRLEEFINLARPQLLIAVGSVAEKNLPAALGKDTIIYTGGKVEGHATVTKVVSVLHPAHMLRMPIAQRVNAVQRTTVVIGNALEELFLAPV